MYLCGHVWLLPLGKFLSDHFLESLTFTIIDIDIDCNWFYEWMHSMYSVALIELWTGHTHITGIVSLFDTHFIVDKHDIVSFLFQPLILTIWISIDFQNAWRRSPFHFNTQTQTGIKKCLCLFETKLAVTQFRLTCIFVHLIQADGTPFYPTQLNFRTR